MKFEPDIDVDHRQMPEDRRYDPILIMSFGLIAFSAVIIAMTVSVMVS